MSIKIYFLNVTQVFSYWERIVWRSGANCPGGELPGYPLYLSQNWSYIFLGVDSILILKQRSLKSLTDNIPVYVTPATWKWSDPGSVFSATYVKSNTHICIRFELSLWLYPETRCGFSDNYLELPSSKGKWNKPCYEIVSVQTNLGLKPVHSTAKSDWSTYKNADVTFSKHSAAKSLLVIHINI